MCTAVAAALFFYVASPYLAAVILAFVFAVLVQPIQRRLMLRFESEHLVTSLTITISLVLVIIPLTILFLIFAQTTADLYGKFQADNFAVLSEMSGPLSDIGELFDIEIDFSTTNLLSEILTWLSVNFNRLFSTTVNVVISIFVWIILSYFIVKDGVRLQKYATGISPLGARSTKRILNRLHNMINAVFRVTLMMGLFQGIMAGIGFWLFGIPHAFALGALTAVLALLPAIGVTIVMVFASMYLFYTAGAIWALGLLIWGAVLVGLAEDFLRPYIVGRYNNVHTALVLLAVLGGVGVFGIIGLILGPIILAFFLAMLEATREELTHNS